MDGIFKCDVNHHGDKPLGVPETHLQCSQLRLQDKEKRK